jgi:spermidine synthase
MPTSKKWFCEGAVPGKRFGKIKHCFLIDKLQFRGKTPYQDVIIFDNPIYGRVVVLDGMMVLFNYLSEMSLSIMRQFLIQFYFPIPILKKFLLLVEEMVVF